MPNQYSFVISDASTETGSWEISDDGYIEIKKEVINKLLENSLKFSLIMIPITFVILLFLNCMRKSLKWIKKYSS